MPNAPEPASGAMSRPCATNGPTLTVRNFAGDIRVAGGSGAGIALSWIKHPDPEVKDWDDWAIEIEANDDSIRAEVLPPPSDRTNRGSASSPVAPTRTAVAHRPPRFSIGIDVNVDCALLALETSQQTGAIDISDIRANRISVVGAASKITLSNCVASIDAETASGAIRLSGCDGKLSATTAAGAIAISTCRGFVRATSASGPVHLAISPYGNGEVLAESVAGAIELDIDPAASGTLDVRTVAGQPAIARELSALGPTRWTFGSGDGVAIQARTAVGHVRATVTQPDDRTGGRPGDR